MVKSSSEQNLESLPSVINTTSCRAEYRLGPFFISWTCPAFVKLKVHITKKVNSHDCKGHREPVGDYFRPRERPCTQPASVLKQICALVARASSTGVNSAE